MPGKSGFSSSTQSEPLLLKLGELVLSLSASFGVEGLLSLRLCTKTGELEADPELE